MFSFQIGAIAKNTPNRGAYSFNPSTLNKADMMHESWKKYAGGIVQIRVAQNWNSDRGDGYDERLNSVNVIIFILKLKCFRIYWSNMIPFGYYFHDVWKYQWGNNWAMDMCIDWFTYDGRRENFYMFLENTYSCPCTLSQAFADVGRFVALMDCDIMGDHSCYYTQGAQHCVVSITGV